MSRSALLLKRSFIGIGLVGLVAGSVICQTNRTAVVSKFGDMPADFKSDGCTWFPDRDYRDCCVEHDKAYYFGGTIKQRKAADDDLYRCVLDRVGPKRKFTAQFMWAGVRLFGISFLPTPFRWGFGNKYPRMSGRKKSIAESSPTDH